MEVKIENLIQHWQKRNIQGIFCENKEKAVQKILEIIPTASSVGISGSVTLDQLAIVERLEMRGNKVFNQYQPGISREENLELRKQGIGADYYLTSANAISQNGELVFLSAYGHRPAGIANAKKVIVVAGVNKITENLDQAMKRAREYATPLNYKRLNWDIQKIMCCQILIIEAEVAQDRLTVILVDDNLGF